VPKPPLCQHSSPPTLQTVLYPDVNGTDLPGHQPIIEHLGRSTASATNINGANVNGAKARTATAPPAPRPTSLDTTYSFGRWLPVNPDKWRPRKCMVNLL
jgi:hypothetical protein